MTLDSGSARRLADLLEMIVSWAGMPVRPMEEVLALGPGAVPAVAEALEEYAEEPDAVAALWLLVLLGQSGDAAAVEPLLEWVGDAGTSPSHRHVAAEGLARIGEPALPALLERLDGGAPEDERLWIYAALGSMVTAERASSLRGRSSLP